MSTESRAGLQLLVSAALLRLSLSDAFLRYVKESMRPWLVASPSKEQLARRYPATNSTTGFSSSGVRLANSRL